jgi:hypothetical protein
MKEEYLDRDLFNHRNLSVRWNDHLIWQRWLPPVFSITRAAIPPASLSNESNLLVLENHGTQDLPLDAVWVEPIPTEGSPFYVSLEDAQWLNRSDSKWVKNTTLTLSLPSGTFKWSPASDFANVDPPLTPADLPNHWQQTLESYRQLQSEAPDLAKVFIPWMQPRSLHALEARYNQVLRHPWKYHDERAAMIERFKRDYPNEKEYHKYLDSWHRNTIGYMNERVERWARERAEQGKGK